MPQQMEFSQTYHSVPVVSPRGAQIPSYWQTMQQMQQMQQMFNPFGPSVELLSEVKVLRE